MFVWLKAADLNWLVDRGQLYWAFPFSKASLNRTVSVIFSWIGQNVLYDKLVSVNGALSACRVVRVLYAFSYIILS